jgi:hypothetical protein
VAGRLERRRAKQELVRQHTQAPDVHACARPRARAPLQLGGLPVTRAPCSGRPLQEATLNPQACRPRGARLQCCTAWGTRHRHPWPPPPPPLPSSLVSWSRPSTISGGR